MSKETHNITDSGYHARIDGGRNPQLETAERWLTSMMEEQSRAIVSRTGTGLLIYDRMADEIPQIASADKTLLISGPESSDHYKSTTEGLAHAVQTAVHNSVSKFGISVERVALQQVNMPPEIYAAAVDACKSAYAPLKAKAEAYAEQMRLKSRSDVIGEEAVGLAEIASSAPALAVQDLLAPLFQQFARRGIMRES